MDGEEWLRAYQERVWQAIRHRGADFWEWTDLARVLEAWGRETAGPPVSDSAVLPLLACGAAGGDPGRALPVTAAWNLYNLASDLLDDLQDGDQAQKQVPWRTWEPALLLQVGLGLLFLGQACLAETTPRIQVLFAETGILAARGQKRYAGTSLPACLERMAATSGLIFSTAAQAGALAAGGSSDGVRRLTDYGAALGMLIQIADDYLDLIGGTVAPDFTRAQYGLPLVYALNQHQQTEDHAALRQGLASQDTALVLQCVQRLGGFRFTAALAGRHANRAVAALEGLNPPYAVELRRYVARIASRIPELAPDWG